MGKTKTARLWTYVRDDRPAGLDIAPAVWFAYTEDRKGEHPRQHLSKFSGILQADGYAGFHHLYEGGRIVEAACWAHYLESVFIWPARSLLARLAVSPFVSRLLTQDKNSQSLQERQDLRSGLPRANWTC